MSPRSLDDRSGFEAEELEKILRRMLAELGSFSQFLELFYFTREPDILTFVRALGAFPDEDRRRLSAFLARGLDGCITADSGDNADSMVLQIAAQQRMPPPPCRQQPRARRRPRMQ